jgi:hypothetical protein
MARGPAPMTLASIFHAAEVQVLTARRAVSAAGFQQQGMRLARLSGRVAGGSTGPGDFFPCSSERFALVRWGAGGPVCAARRW